MTKYPLIDPHSTQIYNNPKNLKIESDITKNQISSPQSSPSPVSSPDDHTSSSSSSSPSKAEISADTDVKLPPLNHLCRLLKELMEMIEKQKTQTISQEFVDMVITELSSFSTKCVIKKGITKKKRERGNIRVCSKCGTNSTPEWRRSPEGSTTLCNACGLKEKKRAKNSTTSLNYGPNKFHHSTFALQSSSPTANPTAAGRVAPQTSLRDYNYPYAQSSAQIRLHPYYRNQDIGPNYNLSSLHPPSIASSGYYPAADEFGQGSYFFHMNGVAPHLSQSFGENPDCSSHPNCPHCLVNNYCDMPVSIYQ
jgi:hypothetical protein